MEAKQLTILKAAEKAHQISQDSKLIMERYDTVKSELQFISDYFQVNKIQSIFLASFISFSCFDTIELKELIDYFKVEKIHLLPYMNDLKCLVDKNILEKVSHRKTLSEDYSLNKSLVEFIVSDKEIPLDLISILPKEHTFYEFLKDLDDLSDAKDDEKIDYRSFVYKFKKLLQENRKFKLVNYAWQVVVFFLAYELLISIDLYLVKGIMRNDYLTGIYNAALTVGRIPYYVFYALTIMLLPVVSKTTAANDHAKTNAIISQSLRLMVIFLVPSVILMAQFAEPIIRIFFSAKYTDAALPMSILVWGVGFLTIFYVMSFVLNGAGKTKISMYISLFGVVINTALNYILIKKYGLVGSAAATSLTSMFVTFIMLYYLIKEFGSVMKISSLAKISAAGVIMYFVSMFFSEGQIIFILWSLLLFSLYLAVLYFMGERGSKDLAYVREIISSKGKKKAVREELSSNEPGV